MLGTETQMPPGTTAERESRTWTWLIAGLVVVLLAGLGIWAIVGSDDADDGQREVATDLADAWIRGWADGDGQAVSAVFADDGVYVTWAGVRVPVSQMAAFVDAWADDATSGERVTELTMLFDDTYTWVHEMDWQGQTGRGVLAIQLDGELASTIGWMWFDQPTDELFPAG